jgi:hypothetical protein
MNSPRSVAVFLSIRRRHGRRDWRSAWPSVPQSLRPRRASAPQWELVVGQVLDIAPPPNRSRGERFWEVRPLHVARGCARRNTQQNDNFREVDRVCTSAYALNALAVGQADDRCVAMAAFSPPRVRCPRSARGGRSRGAEPEAESRVFARICWLSDAAPSAGLRLRRVERTLPQRSTLQQANDISDVTEDRNKSYSSRALLMEEVLQNELRSRSAEDATSGGGALLL